MIKKKQPLEKFVIALTGSILLLITMIYISSNHVISEGAGSDSAGYLLNAKTLLGEYNQKNITPTRIPELPCGSLDEMLTSRIQINGNCETISRLASYPVGLGIMHAVSITIFGDNNLGRGMAMGFSYVGVCLLIFFFTLEITRSKKLALLGTLSFAMAKQSIWSTASNISDLPGAFWIILTTYLFYRIRKNREIFNKKTLLLVVVTAISLCMLVLTREVNVLTTIPLVYLFFKFDTMKRIVFTVSLIALGLPALYIRYFVNGVLFSDSYGGSLWNVMSHEWLARGAGNIFYLIISVIGIGIIFPFVFLKRMEEIEWIFLAQVTVTVTFYVWYQFTGETWWDGRFLLGVMPSLIILTTSRISKMSKILELKLEKTILHPLSTFALNSIIFILIASVILINNTVKFRNSSDTYDFLFNVYPKYRNAEPVIAALEKSYPDGADIVTMHLSASARYYLDSKKYNFIWKPELEKLDVQTINKYYPKSVWVFNNWDLPPEKIRNNIKTKEIVAEYTIGELDPQ